MNYNFKAAGLPDTEATWLFCELTLRSLRMYEFWAALTNRKGSPRLGAQVLRPCW